MTRQRDPLARCLFVLLLCGCTPAPQPNARLEAAIERFERAAEKAEAAAAAAEASAQQAAAAAARQEQATPSGPFAPHLQLVGTDAYRRCSETGRHPVHAASQAGHVAERFLRCLGLAWGKPAAIVYVRLGDKGEWSVYRVEYDEEDGPPPAWERTVMVRTSNGQAEFPLPK
jgi:hypothetical protein